MLDSYAALASGVLIGMSEGLQAGTKTSGASSGGGAGSASSATPAAARASTAPKKSAAPRGIRRR
jgi:hypothetical protein